MLFGQDFFLRLSNTMDDVESPPWIAFWFSTPMLPIGLVCTTDMETLLKRKKL